MRPKLIPAFTLIEVVVAMAIIAILAAVTIVSMSGYRVNALLQRASHRFAGIVREAQNYAVTGRTLSGGPACRYSVKLTGTAPNYTGYELFGKVRGSGPACDGATETIRTTQLPGGIQMSSPVQYFIYELPRANSTLASVVEVQFSKSGINYLVCVYPSGRVEEVGTATSCP